MPTENRVLSQRGSYSLQTTYFSGGEWRVSSSEASNGISRKTTTVRTSTSTPKFRSRLRPTPLPVNPFSFVQTIESYGVGWRRNESATLIQGRPQTTNVFSGHTGEDFPPILTAPSEQVSAMDNRMITDLLLRIKDQKVNLWQAYAEREQTAKTIGDMATRVYKGLRNLKRGDFAGAADAFGVKAKSKLVSRFSTDFGKDQRKAIASGWLELQYGWLPLIGDVYGAAEALAKAHLGIPREKVKIRRTLSGERTSLSTPNALQRLTDVGTYTIQLQYGCTFTAQSSELKTLSELGITNPTLIGWELMPWSFVIDWFIPIGDYVASWDATLGLTFKSGYRTEFRREKTVRKIVYGPDNGTGGKLTGYAESSQEKVTCIRTKLTTFPSALLPDFKNPLGVQHMLNAIALLQQLR